MARILLLLSLCTATSGGTCEDAPRPRHPNVIVILTDDQGHGDLGFHGNPTIRTPHIDCFARESVQLERFYVSPVCAPTRASLLTGRYNFRTGAVDTYLGRALMHPDEVTLAEMLAPAGYRRGIFGKWHLGDNYPLRPMDQGFEECLVHRGGGIGQPADPPGNSYFDPVLEKNGQPVKAKGYASDVFTDAALEFIAAHRAEPFFVYLAFNCPHEPLQVPDAYRVPYAERGEKDLTARVYGMITNIDDSVGRLLAKLEELGLAKDTIVVFLTDNGPQHERWNGGLRGRKGSVFDGGIRVPCFIRWPGRFEPRKVDRIAAHIDLVPTILHILEAYGVAAPKAIALDGVSLLPLLEGRGAAWPDRTLYFQWHRGDEPEPFRAFAALSQRWKLAQPEGAGNERPPANAPLLLFDMPADPFETTDVATRHPEIVEEMRKGYEAWFRDVASTRGFAPPRIRLGSPRENPTTLTRQDWRGPRAGWGPKDLGHWEVEVERSGKYEITLRFEKTTSPATARCALGGVALQSEVPAGAVEWVFKEVSLPAGPARLEAWLERDGEKVGAHYVDVRSIP